MSLSTRAVGLALVPFDLCKIMLLEVLEWFENTSNLLVDSVKSKSPEISKLVIFNDCVAISIGNHHIFDNQAPTGFSEQINPLNVVGGVGDLLGLIRQELPVRKGAANMAKDVGSGETTYSNYDKNIARDAQNWIKNRKITDIPWVLFVSFV